LASTTRDKLALRHQVDAKNSRCATQVVRAEATYLAVVLIVAVLLSVHAPFPMLTWFGRRQNAAAGLSR